ncbi:flagellar assembly peptidoglycan hydrolase FlgJ [Psychrosphaera sp. 1_MG-2023]|uniref:flagellar assembly peptidoglycan hydrolase FlgJ n=1 Tax=Psychrosphaera sp. 1_MG-2023 TaxID=3062643 RepID=UPI0026E2D2B9|nr:flagellar assembly peptidoglycan hydrolase FlgJ [Psychrosphaera sp. 1_MG-2023]MDO6718407.1 flagellar assembly peptidoglycan hydrolase FlgJ [Psychrosphaera sp. 1_MG-2023]
MNQLGDAGNYLDIAGIQQLKAHAGANPDDKEALKQAAEHFESIFINMMLQSMRKANAAFEEGNPMHSNTTKFFRDMYDQQLATDMASKGSLGLSELIVQQLSNDPERYRNGTTLRNDATFERHEFGNTSQTNAQTTDPLNQYPTDKLPLSASFLDPALLSPNGVKNHFNQMVDDAFKHVGLTVNPVATDIAQQQKKEPAEFDTPKDFVSQIWSYAKKAASEIGLNPAVMVAQTALETGWGKHIIEDKNGESSFNLFNVKAHRDWEGAKAAQSTLEFENGLPVRKIEPFRVYDNFSESFDDFVNFLKSNGRYDEALERTGNAEHFLHSLQKAGYATDPNYADKILGILQSNSFKTMIGDLDVKPQVE